MNPMHREEHAACKPADELSFCSNLAGKRHMPSHAFKVAAWLKA